MNQFRKSMSERGFTLVELLVICAILGVLALLIMPSYDAMTKKVKFSRCGVEIRTLEKDITSFVAEKGVLPSSLTDINRDTLKDPWGNSYQFLNISLAPGSQREDSMTNPLNVDFDLFSMGPDGISNQSLSDPSSNDDCIRAADGYFVGSGSDYESL